MSKTLGTYLLIILYKQWLLDYQRLIKIAEWRKTFSSINGKKVGDKYVNQ